MRASLQVKAEYNKLNCNKLVLYTNSKLDNTSKSN